MQSNIQHDTNKQLFFTLVEDKMATLNYSLVDKNTLDFRSTFVPVELRGQHIGQNLVKFALDYALEKNLHIIPTCGFVKKYIQQNPQYNKLIFIA